LSQELYDFLRHRARQRGPGWPLCFSVSVGFHLLVAAAIFTAPKTEARQQEPKVTWVTLPGAAPAAPLGGAGPMEQGKEGERQRRVEEVAPRRPEPAGAAVTPNAFGPKPSRPVKGTSENQESLGKAPVAAKGPAPAPNPAIGAAGQGSGGAIGIGSSIPGLKAAAGIQGGSGLISDLDQDFPFMWYLVQIQNRITGNWNRITSDTGRVQIYFRINRDGTIEGARVETTSGFPSLDQSALLAVRRSDPLGPLPEGNSLGVRFWFIYLGH